MSVSTSSYRVAPMDLADLPKYNYYRVASQEQLCDYPTVDWLARRDYRVWTSVWRPATEATTLYSGTLMAVPRSPMPRVRLPSMSGHRVTKSGSLATLEWMLARGDYTG
jgi:hypothetical protein